MAIDRLVIRAGQTEGHYWRDLWRYRGLFYILSWRDILVRYKQTAIGIAWAVLRPLLTMIVFVIVFSKIAKLPSDGTPYPIFVFSAMLPWYFFSTAFSEAGNSLVSNSNLISKVYFPRLIIPASSVIVSLVDFGISFLMLVCMLFWFDFMPTWRMLTLPLFILIAFFVSLGTGLWVAALSVKYRDFRYIVPFVVQFGLYISPVGFSSSIVPEKWRMLYSINPMVGVIDGFRWAICGGKVGLYMNGFWLSLLLVVAICVSGIVYFRKTEKAFADII
jgi:lipopolysaccharide transport system permease protein